MSYGEHPATLRRAVPGPDGPLGEAAGRLARLDDPEAAERLARIRRALP